MKSKKMKRITRENLEMPIAWYLQFLVANKRDEKLVVLAKHLLVNFASNLPTYYEWLDGIKEGQQIKNPASSIILPENSKVLTQ